MQLSVVNRCLQAEVRSATQRLSSIWTLAAKFLAATAANASPRHRTIESNAGTTRAPASRSTYYVAHELERRSVKLRLDTLRRSVVPTTSVVYDAVSILSIHRHRPPVRGCPGWCRFRQGRVRYHRSLALLVAALRVLRVLCIRTPSSVVVASVLEVQCFSF